MSVAGTGVKVDVDEQANWNRRLWIAIWGIFIRGNLDMHLKIYIPHHVARRTPSRENL
jgi:hypothetical protein